MGMDTGGMEAITIVHKATEALIGTRYQLAVVNTGSLWDPGAASLNTNVVPSKHGRQGEGRVP